TPWISSSLLKPWLTPVTRFATIERDMPHCWRARLDRPRGVTVTAPLSIARLTSSVAVKERVPFGPFTSMVWPFTSAVTPWGSSSGFLPSRDILPFLEHGAEDFAADIGTASRRIRHHAFRRRDDGHAKAVADQRDVLDRSIDTTAGFRHASKLADHRGAVKVFQADFQLGMAGFSLNLLITADVAFCFKHVQHPGAQLGGGRTDGRFAAHLCVADAGQHIAER